MEQTIQECCLVLGETSCIYFTIFLDSTQKKKKKKTTIHLCIYKTVHYFHVIANKFLL